MDLPPKIKNSCIWPPQSKLPSSAPASLPSTYAWSPPPTGWLNINFDTIVQPNNVYFVAIFDNHLGKITHAWTGSNVHGDLLWAKAKAWLLTITCASTAGLDLHYFLRRCYSCHWFYYKLLIHPSPVHDILYIGDINLALKSFVCCFFPYVLRCANVIAHSLVTWAVGLPLVISKMLFPSPLFSFIFYTRRR